MILGHRFYFVALSFGFALSSGCGTGRYPVNGIVHYSDNAPVESGTVIAEASIDGKLVGVQANIEKNGSFHLGGITPGDGALPGNYRVAVMPVTLGDSELAAGKIPSVESKFSRFETSGITFEVKPETNKMDIVVSKPQPKK